jgi:membrane associated rhomboid family serine protease
MSSPLCPRCHDPLNREKTQGALYYHCVQCFGICITVAPLRKLADPRFVTALWLSVRDAPEANVSCPYCLRLMRSVTAPNEGLELDACVSCHCLWLDHGELDRLPAPLVEKKREQPEEARKLLARLELDQMEKRSVAHKIADLTQDDEETRMLPDLPAHKVMLSLIGLPVQKHASSLRTAPLSTWTLLALCSAVSLYGFQNPSAMRYFQFVPQSDGLQLILSGLTSFFVHGGWFHLLGNMYFLFTFGEEVEDELGKSGYLLLVAAASVAGALVYGFFAADKSIPLVGASGGISGLIGFYMIRFPRRKFVLQMYFRWFTAPAFLLILIFLLKDLVGAYTQLIGQTNVSHISHLAGIAVGIFAAYLSGKKESPNPIEQSPA